MPACEKETNLEAPRALLHARRPACRPGFRRVEGGRIGARFQAQASFAGKASSYSLKDALRKGPVVVYFYPSAYTGACNVQAREFAERSDKFGAMGASIIGVSLDSIARLNEFSADPEYCNGKFPVASDADGRIAKSYDLSVKEGRAGQKDTRGNDIGHDFAERTTFVVAPDGTIFATVGGMAPKANVEKALEAVQSFAGSARK
jgi:peroxiredoxin